MGDTVRLATLNMASGRDADGVVRVERLASAVAALGADVVALQEVDHRLPRSAGVDQAAVVAAACAEGGAPWHHRFAAALHGSPGPEGGARPAPATLPDEPSYGVALLSRFPVTGWRELRLAAARARLPMALPPGTRPPVWFVPDEQRVALAARVETPGGPLTVVSTHLSFAPWGAVRQLRAVRTWVATLPRPLVLLGDLNLPGTVPARVTGWQSLVGAATYPSAGPRVQLDHALADGLDRPVAGASAVTVGGSDHLGLVVTLGSRP
jgi:endonuclease/exonuclease/phosphatase family metal-dependent hydrolase